MLTGQHITYVMLVLTAISVACHVFNRKRPHAAGCRCQWCVKQDQDENP